MTSDYLCLLLLVWTLCVNKIWLGPAEPFDNQFYKSEKVLNMLRRPPTTLQLSQDDVAELIAELEEEKLQLRIQSQRKNLTRSSTRLEPGTVEGRDLTEPASIDSSFQISPLDGKRLQLDATDGPPSASLNWSNRQNVGMNTTDNGVNAEGNPFYNSQSRT